MKGLTSSLSVFSIIVLVLSSLGSFSPPREVKASTATSLFGYTWSASIETFQEISGVGTELTSFEGDDIWSSELPLGFFFPFFENSYSSVYISSNGFLFFGTSLPGSAATNSSIPSEIKPNNLIAPFWDDLVIGDNVNQGRVFCYLSGTEPTRIFIIEFKDVTRLGDNNFPFTFEVILHESGNIEIRYASMTGDLDKATIGIEDIDGIDGLELLYNSIGPLSNLSSNKSYLLTYPEDNPRFKMSPLFQSNFLISGSVLFPVTIKNTGLHPDVFNLEWLLVDSFDDDGWAFEFLDENLIALNDSDGNSQVDTGTLQSGASKQILIKIIGPADPAQVGAFVLYDLVTTSKLSVDIGSSLSTSVQIQAANPAPFVQVFSTPYDPAYYEVFHPRQPVDYPGLHFIRAAMVEYDYYNSLTVISAGNQRYLSAWENNQYIFSSIHYSLGDIAVIGSPEIRTVQDNTQTGSGTNKVFDRLPSLAVAENGISAIAFVREITALDDSKNSNVMLALLDPAGSVAQILQLTDNTSFGFSQQVGIPFFNNPRVASTGTNFVISWDEQKATSDNGILLNIQVTSVTSSGMTLTNLHHDFLWRICFGDARFFNCPIGLLFHGKQPRDLSLVGPNSIYRHLFFHPNPNQYHSGRCLRYGTNGC